MTADGGGNAIALVAPTAHASHDDGAATAARQSDEALGLRTRKTQLGDLSVGVTATLGMSAEEISSLVRRALVRMVNEFGVTAADTAQI